MPHYTYAFYVVVVGSNSCMPLYSVDLTASLVYAIAHINDLPHPIPHPSRVL